MINKNMKIPKRFARLKNARFLFHASGLGGFSFIVRYERILNLYKKAVEQVGHKDTPDAKEFMAEIDNNDTWGGGNNQPFSWHKLYALGGISITEIYTNRSKYR